MKVRISYIVEVTDEIRAAMREHYAQTGLATREEVKAWYQSYGLSGDQDLNAVADAKFNEALEEEKDEKWWE